MKRKIIVANPYKKRKKTVLKKPVVKRITKRRKKNPTKLHSAYKALVKHRPVTYGTKKSAGVRSPLKKLNPKGSVKMKKIKRRKRRAPSIKRITRRRVRSNPGRGTDIMNMIANGALGGVAAIGTLFISKHLSPMITKDATGKAPATKTTRNIIQLFLASAVGYAAHKFLDKEKANAVSTGVIASVVMTVLNSSFDLGLLGAEADIDAIISEMSGDIYDDDMAGSLEDETSLLGLLEGDMSDPMLLGLLEGQDDDSFSGLLEGEDDFSFAGVDEEYE